MTLSPHELHPELAPVPLAQVEVCHAGQMSTQLAQLTLPPGFPDRTFAPQFRTPAVIRLFSYLEEQSAFDPGSAEKMRDRGYHQVLIQSDEQGYVTAYDIYPPGKGESRAHGFVREGESLGGHETKRLHKDALHLIGGGETFIFGWVRENNESQQMMLGAAASGREYPNRALFDEVHAAITACRKMDAASTLARHSKRRGALRRLLHLGA